MLLVTCSLDCVLFMLEKILLLIRLWKGYYMKQLNGLKQEAEKDPLNITTYYSVKTLWD